MSPIAVRSLASHRTVILPCNTEKLLNCLTFELIQVHKSVRSTLNFVSEKLDSVARLGRHRFVKEKDVGIAHGEQILKRLLTFLVADMVFDVGGNIGQYGQQLRRKVGYRGPLISFEPIPHAAARIRATAGDESTWQVRECAVDDVRGKASFNIMAGDQFSSLLAPSKEFEGRFYGQHKVQKTVDVDVITLGDAVADAPSFARGLLKLDTQGTELRLLRGGVDSLSRFPAIQLEVGFQALYDGEGSYAEVVDQLDGWGYRLCGLFPNNQGHFPHLLEMDAVFLRKEFLPELP